MTRRRTIGLGSFTMLVVLLAVSPCAYGASTPEFGRCLKKAQVAGSGYSDAGCTKAVSSGAQYEWTTTIVKRHFTTKLQSSTLATLETVGGEKITCKGESGSGEIATTTEIAAVVATFTECSTSAMPCESAGQPDGTIITNSLSGILGIESIGLTASADKLAEELHGPSGGALASFSCAGVPFEVTGSVLHPTASNKMLLTATEKFTATKGEQKTEKFAGGTSDEHVLEIAGAGEAGLTLTMIVSFEEKIEARAGVVEEGEKEACSADPSILLYPNNTTVVVGERATFTAEASTPPHCAEPTVKWYRIAPEGTTQEEIPGATSNTYTTEPTTLAENGTRFVVCFTNEHSTTCANEGKKVGWTLTVSETSSPCDSANVETPKFNEEGQVVLPSGAEEVSSPVESELEQGTVNKLFPTLNTTLDTWYPKALCEWSIGGTVPPEAQPGGEEEKQLSKGLEELEITATPGEVQTKLGEIGGEMATSASEAPAGTVLPQLCPITKEKTVPPCTYSTVGAPALTEGKPFGGRDIIFVHGLETHPFSEELKAGESQGAILPTWPAEPAAFNTETGYWKKLANEYWAPHIKRWLYGNYPNGAKLGKATNRYLTIAWASTQRLVIAANTMLAQIRDAMLSGKEVKNEAEETPNGRRGFCATGCVLISQSTGGLLTDVAMSIANTTRWGNLKFITKHMRAHIAEHDAFNGSGLATAAVALGKALPAFAQLCQIGVLVINVMFETEYPGKKCNGLTRVAEVIPNSVLVDLVPQISQSLWGSKLEAMPVQTLTTAGGHPTANGIDAKGEATVLFTPIDKLIFHPGFDDGVVNMNSQCANSEQVKSWPSGFTPKLSFLHANVFDMGIPPLRASHFYVAQIIDPKGSGGAPVAGGCTPFVAPDGMVEPWKEGESSLKRYKNHYSFLQDTADHFIGPLNFSTEFGGETECYLVTNPQLWTGHFCTNVGREDNNEEVRAITNAAVYAPPANCVGAGPACASLVNPVLKGMVEQITVGKSFTFKWFRHRHTWWLWKRTYNLLQNWKAWVENDYVYNYVLK
jgi:hypothetical protein